MVETKRDSAFTRFFRGASYFGKAFGFVTGQRGLWPWVLAPTALTAVAAIFGGWSFYHWAGGWMDKQAAGHGAFFAALLSIILFVLVAGMGYVAFFVASLVATAPFAGLLSEKAEALSTGAPLPKKSLAATVGEIVRGLGHTLLTVSIFLAVQAVMFGIHFFVAPLAPFVWFFNLFFTGAFLAYDGFDAPLSRRDSSFGDKWRFVGAHLAEALGFGVVVALVLALPGFNLVVPAVSIVGGTLLYLDLQKRV